MSLPAGLGLGTVVQAVPFHRRISGLVPVPLEMLPIAQAVPAEVVVTPRRTAPCPGLGLGTRVQVVPFQCRISVLVLVSQPTLPTAQALSAPAAATSAMEDAAVTPTRVWHVPRSGLGVRVQVVPFQCRISVLLLLPLPAVPTAQALSAEVAATAVRSPLVVKVAAVGSLAAVGGLGLVWAATTTATATTATATPAAMAVLAGAMCRGLRCRRSRIRCTAAPCTAAGPPEGHSAASSSVAAASPDRPRSSQPGP